MEATKRLIYYRTTNQIQLPSNSSWRYWKFQLEEGTWKIVKGIKSITELRDKLVQFNPVAFYYSTSEFLNQKYPIYQQTRYGYFEQKESIEHPNYVTADQLFLQNQFLIIDIDNLAGKSQVRRSAHDVLKKMEKFKDTYLYKQIVFTGRGCRLEFEDVTEKPVMMPQERELWLRETRKEFCQINLSDISGVDDVIAWDTRRVVKGIGSPNLYNNEIAIVYASPSYIPAIPGKLVNEKNTDKREQGRATDQELGNSPPFPLYFGRFIRNKVEGTKDRFVPCFSYHKKFRYWKDDLLFLQRKYGLSTIYIVDDYMKVTCLSVDAVPAPRLDKIYNDSVSLSKRLWNKFKNIHIRTSCFFNQDLKQLHDYDLKPLFKVDNSPQKIYPLSEPHINFLNHIGFKLENSFRIKIGNNKNTIYEAFFEKRKFGNDR